MLAGAEIQKILDYTLELVVSVRWNTLSSFGPPYILCFLKNEDWWLGTEVKTQSKADKSIDLPERKKLSYQT